MIRPPSTVSQVWMRTAPRGEQRVQATLLFQGKEVARLEFGPANGSLLARGQELPLPPVPGAPRVNRGPFAPLPPSAAPDAPAASVAAAPDAAVTNNAPVPPATIVPPAPPAGVDTPAPSTAPVRLDQVKGRMPGRSQGLECGPGSRGDAA